MGTGSDDRHERPPTSLRDLPPALPVRALFGSAGQHDLAVFLDYDGTLTAIVDDPDAAVLTEAMRSTLRDLAAATLVAIVSGRDLADVRAKVGIEGIAYAGSHGFDILHPDGTRRQLATSHLDVLDRANTVLERELGDIPGIRIERKAFAIAVHDRQVADAGQRERIAQVVGQVAAEYDELRATGGKRINELRPDVDWDKGRAIDSLLTELGAEDRLPLYLGDDLTDEDGFRAVHEHGGVAVVVRGEDDGRPSVADAALEGIDQVRRFLGELRDLVTGGSEA